MRSIGGAVVAFAVIVSAAEAIRVYEGTKLGRPDNSTRQPEPFQRAESRSDSSQTPVFRNELLKFSKELKQTPNLYKVKLTQQGYLQFLRYLADIPPLREYTFCVWLMLRNLSHPQPLFSYSVQGEARLLSLWYEPKDATVRMSIRDDLVFRVPALVHADNWHHICQSWNGIHGEWILFLDGSKIGSGQLHKYKGTYVPGGGEVVVGQEPADFQKGLDDGIEGEIFGFNLVDESVQDEFVTIKHRFLPEKLPESAPTAYVPPFKTLPPMKKSYQEIKAYIKSLPSEPVHYGIRNGGKRQGNHPPPKPHHKSKPPKHPPRPPRNKQRPRYKPVKAIVYERDDRQLRMREPKLNKKLGLLPPEPNSKINQIYNENYSIHSYRITEEKPRAVGSYEIYEVQDEGDGLKEGKRKARQNFNIYTARQANNLYAVANRVQQKKKPAYHFELNKGKDKMQQGIRRSITVKADAGKIDISKSKMPIEFIPVYEIIEDDLPLLRRKRDASGGEPPASDTPFSPTGILTRVNLSEDDLMTNFRPLPKIPDGFINLFANSQTKADMDKKLSQFFPNNTENVPTQSPTSTSTLTPITEKFLPITPEPDKLAMRNDVFDVPPTHLHIRRNMVVSIKDLEKRPGITAGTELVKRSYEECVADRGSPVKDKDRLVISWAETPVRIYGGAVVTTALDICGHF